MNGYRDSARAISTSLEMRSLRISLQIRYLLTALAKHLVNI